MEIVECVSDVAEVSWEPTETEQALTGAVVEGGVLRHGRSRQVCHDGSFAR